MEETRRSTRKRKTTVILNIDDKPKMKKTKKIKKIEKIEKIEKMEEPSVDNLTNVLKKYVSEIIESLRLPPEQEKTKIDGLIKNIENSISLKNNIYVNRSKEYLVSSSSRKETYTVKESTDTLKNVCNCGEKYKEPFRNSCKHCGAIVFYNLHNYLTDYLNKETPSQIIQVEKLLDKCDLNEKIDFCKLILE